MKRVDDKLKEIERKNRLNRRLYMGFILLIAEKRNIRKNSTISDLEIKNSAAYQNLDSSKIHIEKLFNSLKLTNDSLERSLSPKK